MQEKAYQIIPCLQNLVGLKGSCDHNQPRTGLFINSLPGISIKKVSAASGEYTRGETFFKDLYQEAIQELKILFRSKLEHNFMFNEISQKRRIGYIGKDLPPMPIQKGIHIEPWTESLYKQLKVETISFRAGNEGLAKIWIDSIEGREEREYVIKKGRNTIRLDLLTTEATHIILDPAIWIADKGSYGQSGCACRYDCNCADDYDCSCGNYAIRMMECHDGEWKYIGQGIQVHAHICSDDTDLFCQFATDLALPLRMLIGIKLMEQVLASESQNPVIRNTKEEAREFLAKWQGGDNPITGFNHKSEFWKLMSPVCRAAKQYLEGMKDDLVYCDGSVVYSEVIP